MQCSQKAFVAPGVFFSVGNRSKWLFECLSLPTPGLNPRATSSQQVAMDTSFRVAKPSANFMMALGWWVQSSVNRAYSRGPGPVLSVIMEEQWGPSLTDCGWCVRKCFIQM